MPDARDTDVRIGGGWAFADHPALAAHLAASCTTAAQASALSALGDEHHLRHRAAWSAVAFTPHEDDARVARTWTDLLDGDLSPRTLRSARQLAGPPVRAAFRALGRGLGLPPDLTERHVRDAEEALHAFALGAHLDVASRVVETQGPPLRALASAVPETLWPRLEACVAGRPAWQAGLDAVAATPVDASPAARLEAAADWAIARRALDALGGEEDAAADGELPGWSVVRAHHDRMRGRLRALLRTEPATLASLVPRLGALAARTDAALRRWAWAWAWREARVGFAFSLERTAATACVVERVHAPDAPSLDEAVVRTFVLSMAGRGAWTDLRRWVAGEPGRTLSTRFYRYLAQAPDTLADPGEPTARARSYEGLRAHLAAGGLAAHADTVRSVAQATRDLGPGRDLRARLHAALAPWWDAEALPLPAHHLPDFLTGLAEAAAVQTTASATPG
ncbi:MAG: hypothetical protein H6732_14140 [Alphaproteobacteria bacterium]|nr:hypothetical protein [Alphaproteobacteria bacterium]